MAPGSRHLEVVEGGEGWMRQEAVGPTASHREICERVAEVLVVLRGGIWARKNAAADRARIS